MNPSALAIAPTTSVEKPHSTHSVGALYKHQEATVALLREEPYVFDASDPGTGKTRGALTGFAERRAAGAGPALVIAPKTILGPAWAEDIKKFFPGLTYVVANATNREKAFKLKVDIYITNHDATRWLIKNWKSVGKLFEKDATLIIDESTAFKNPTAQRSKAAKTLSTHFAYREVMSGTPNPNTILELWHQMMLCDGGQRLGQSYWKFRAIVCEPKQIGPRPDMIEWVDRPGAQEAVADLIGDITIRHRFEDCISIPPNVQRDIVFDLEPATRRAYQEMKQHALFQLQNGNVVEAVHAAALNNKLLQIASGAVYTGVDDEYHLLDNSRTELVLDLVEARSHSLVAFLWKHQRDALVAEAERRGLSYAVIDGSVKGHDRNTAVRDFQAGDLRVIFAHPKSGGHGLTLTRGIATIWTSPTYVSEFYKQFFHRIYRNGQDKQTETIHITARNTIDEAVYARLGGKLTAMQLLLDLVETDHVPDPAPTP